MRTNYYAPASAEKAAQVGKDSTTEPAWTQVERTRKILTGTVPMRTEQSLGNDSGVAAMRERLGQMKVGDKPDTTVPADDDIKPSAQSWVIREPEVTFNLATAKGKEEMYSTLPSETRLRLDQPYGKDDANHSFTNEACFRHCLLPLYYSSFLAEDEWEYFCTTNNHARKLATLLSDYGNIDFRPLRTNYFPPGWEDATDFDYHRSAMLTSCFLHYKGSAAAVTRYVGGPLIGDHRDVPKILRNIRGMVPDHIYNSVQRVYTVGAPAYCNASSTEANLNDYLEYGNHKTVSEGEDVLHKAMLKDEKRGHVIRMDPRLLEFIIHLHVCPIGLVDLKHAIKKPRPIFDASHKPHPLSETINTWTNKSTEPSLEFPATFMAILRWIWNMRVRYPTSEIYLLDDDVTAAFRMFSWHPNLVSMHGLQALNAVWLMVRLTFGDCTSPPNFEPIAIARRYLARQYFNQPDIVERAAKWMPQLTVVEPSDADKATFMQIPPDSTNPGVQRSGSQAPDTPPYVHHVDDCLYGALRAMIERAIAASIVALYDVAGEPVPTQPDPFSYEKFELLVTHVRKMTGAMIDSRSMYVWYPDYKRQQLVDLLASWLVRGKFTVLEGLELQGKLIDASRFDRWGRTHFFILQGAVSKALRARYMTMKNIKGIDDNEVKRRLSRHQLTESMIKKLKTHYCNEIYAQYLYRTRDTTPVSTVLRYELQLLHDKLADFTQHWRINIGHLIPRSHFLTSTSDSAFYGVGFWSNGMRVICMVPTSDSIRARCHLTSSRNPRRIYMNQMEYIGSILDFGCTLYILEDDECKALRSALFPNGVPPMVRTLSRKDNKVSETWIRKAATTSFYGQQLIRIMAELGKDSEVKQDGNHIDGDDNFEADDLSRPDKPNKRYSLDPDVLVAWFDHVIAKYPRFGNYKVFIPSRNLFDAIAWALRPITNVAPGDLEVPTLTKPYGRLVTCAEFRVSMEIMYDEPNC